MNSPTQRASILAIGTELTTGQITNRNAAWLSEKLVNLGVDVVLHETVADDHAMIASALDRCRALSTLIFVTGGLGPTTDDFTRECVAEWLGKPLKYFEPSWKRIEERLTRFGIPVAESNRQQCYFPEGSEVIPNEQGTADAFSAPVGGGFASGGAQLWVLPGPPREIEAVWQGTIETQVRALVPEAEPLKLLTWQCLGKSEAELGEITERTLKGSGLQTGYRAHRPFVEVKVWCTTEDMRSKAFALAALDRALAPWTATKQGEDLAARLLSRLGQADEIEIFDAASGGVLAERLGALLREPGFEAQAEAIALSTEWVAPRDPLGWVEKVLDDADPQTLTLCIAGFTEDGRWALGFRHEQLRRAEPLASPFKNVELQDRSRRYAVEMALKLWSEWTQGN